MDSNRPLKNFNGEKESVYLFTIKGVDKKPEKKLSKWFDKTQKVFSIQYI